MKKLDLLANDILYGDMVKKLAVQRNLGLTEARTLLSQMSFTEYRKLEEDNTTIVPPSGNTITPTTGPTNSNNSLAAGAAKSTWTGKGPIQPGMTIGLKGPNGLPVPGEVSQVDISAKGVKVKNPTTGQDEWMNMDTIEPFMANSQQITESSSVFIFSGYSTFMNANKHLLLQNGLKVMKTTFDELEDIVEFYVSGPDAAVVRARAAFEEADTNGEEFGGVIPYDPEIDTPGKKFPDNRDDDDEVWEDISRIRELAGISEMCSGGATGAGAIAVAPASLGKMKKREPAEEALQTEYTPRSSAKTIVGDTKPSQASGKLSADLAASGKVTASRLNNGRKRR